MQKNIIYIAVSFVLCFVFKAQAQNTITAYEAKLTELSDDQAERLDFLINGAAPSLYIGGEDETPQKYVGNEEAPLVIYVDKFSDLSVLTTHFKDELSGIKVLNIYWDGKEQANLSDVFFDLLPALEYIYIRSEEELRKSVISNRLPRLINQLEGKTNVEILFYKMEEPS